MMTYKSIAAVLFIFALYGCGSSIPTFTLRHSVRRPALLHIEAIQSLIIGQVQNDNKSYPHTQRLRAALKENFIRNGKYPIVEEETPNAQTAILLSINVESMSTKESYDTTQATKSNVLGLTILPEIHKKEEKHITVHCRLTDKKNQGIIAVKSFTKHIVKNKAEMRTWEQLEMQATDDIAASVVGWIAPYEDMLEFALLEDNNALYITNSNAMVLEKNYTQALDILKKTTDSAQFNPDYHKAWYNMGCLYVILNQYDNAKQCFERAYNMVSAEQIYSEKLALITQLIKEKEIKK
jgi:tetratricopeptide (TPR) repeat protein